MKQGVHPQYFDQAQVICVCGNRFTVGSTSEVIHVELCSNCHPFYTGEQKFIDTQSKIQRFQEKQKKAEAYKAVKVKKQEDKKKQDESPKTLREMLMSAK